MVKTYLVTGGAGFIGSNFVHYLFRTYGENVRVIVVDALTYAGCYSNLEPYLGDEQFCFLQHDICDISCLELPDWPIDYLVHFAAESHVDRSILDGAPFVRTNVLGTQALLDFSRRNSVGRFVHVSTDEVYGELGDTGYFTEETPLAPNSPYSASKAGSDLLVRSYVETHGLNAVITRCSNNYGPYQFPEKLIPLMISNALSNKPLPVYGKGLNVRDWIYVEDHCAGVDLATRQGEKGEVYNFGGDSEMKNIDVVKNILSHLKKPESLITYVEDRKGHDFRYAIDFSKAKKTLGWRPSVTFEEGLRKTIEWYVSHTSWLESIHNGSYRV